jgi:hypothetical protein
MAAPHDDDDGLGCVKDRAGRPTGNYISLSRRNHRLVHDENIALQSTVPGGPSINGPGDGMALEIERQTESGRDSTVGSYGRPGASFAMTTRSQPRERRAPRGHVRGDLSFYERLPPLPQVGANRTMITS